MTKPLVRRLGLTALVVGLTVLFDQVTKKLATASLAHAGVKSYLGDTVRLEYARNPGAFLSLGADLSEQTRWILFTVGVGIVLLFLLYAVLTQEKLSTGQRVAYLLMVGGGLSNGYDRVALGGRVTDFMNLGLGSLRTGIFNVADLAIVAGVVLMLFTGRAPKPTPIGSGTAPSTPGTS